jgi:hypothetical protein
MLLPEKGDFSSSISSCSFSHGTTCSININ